MDERQSRAIARLEEIDREVTMLGHIQATLSWDFETSISPKGGEERGSEMAYISSLIHSKITSPEVGELLETLKDVTDLTDRQKALVRLDGKAYRDGVLVPSDLVKALAEAQSRSQDFWFKARKTGDWEGFKPFLAALLDLEKEEASLRSSGRGIYDTLLDSFEPGFDSSYIKTLFDSMEKTVKDVMEMVKDVPVDDSFLYQKYPVEGQKAFSEALMKDMGFDFERGLVGVSAHPFTSSVGVDDIRITTRYEDPNVTSQILSIIHETGHAIYEMGASSGENKGTSLGGGVSMGFHESQSRLWENLAGRSVPFWEHYFPLLKDTFPTQLEGVKFEPFLRAVNRVKADDIRVNADEVTYSLHIILRFRLEQALFDGSITLDDLPGVWDEMSLRLLGKKPDTIQSGVLQDVHWPSGMFGYFPSYALGNLINAQIWDFMGKSLDIDSSLKAGNLLSIKDFLDRNFYKYGAVYETRDLLRKVTSKDLDPSFFDTYLKAKYSALYGKA